MQTFPATFVLRHKKENLNKCSLRGLENREDFCFLRYPTDNIPLLKNYITLALDAPPLTSADTESGLFIIDSTWRYAERMLTFVEKSCPMEKRSIPPGFKTAYPRRQDDCPDPEAGLASIEAVYIAYKILQRDTAGLLDNYYWKNAFLEKNRLQFAS